MKHITYTFSEADIKTCIYALSLLPLLHDSEDISDVQIEINNHCATSAMKNLSTHSQLAPNELRVLAGCIVFGNQICEGSIPVDDTTRRECLKYIFSFNKLENELVSQIMDF